MWVNLTGSGNTHSVMWRGRVGEAPRLRGCRFAAELRSASASRAKPAREPRPRAPRRTSESQVTAWVSNFSGGNGLIVGAQTQRNARRRARTDSSIAPARSWYTAAGSGTGMPRVYQLPPGPV